MKSKLSRVATFVLLAFVMVSCGQVMITGRKQFLLYSQGEITSLSAQSYTELKKTATVSTNAKYNKMVNDVGVRITTAVADYVKQVGAESALNGITWKFEVFKDTSVNAFCLPNGNIVFYEGIMPITNNPDYVAVVMGHEIAHALAKHGNERMSQEALVGVAGEALAAFTGSQNEKTQAIFGMAFGLGTQLGVLLPYSRKHEYEADRIGLILMAMAGYDINKAPTFWEAMSTSGSSKRLEFFSTHPSDENRIRNIKAILPEAAKYVKKQ